MPNKETDKQFVATYINQDLYDRWIAQADKEDRSYASLMRQAIKMYLKLMETNELTNN
jgi:DNA-binding transcriptional MocR family regulator